MKSNRNIILEKGNNVRQDNPDIKKPEAYLKKKEASHIGRPPHIIH